MDNIIGVQMTQDPNVRAYHTKVELTEKQAESGAKGATDEVGELSKMILEIRGVERVIMTPYTVLVGKAQLFGWEEVEPAVLDLLKSLSKTILGIEVYSIRELEESLTPTSASIGGAPPVERKMRKTGISAKTAKVNKRKFSEKPE